MPRHPSTSPVPEPTLNGSLSVQTGLAGNNGRGVAKERRSSSPCVSRTELNRPDSQAPVFDLSCPASADESSRSLSRPSSPMPLPSLILRDDSDDMTRLQRCRSRLWRSPWSCSPLTSLIGALGLVVLFAIVRSYLTLQIDPKGCQTPSMLPTYIKLLGFDAEHTRFSGKYALYLYRERDVDEYDEQEILLNGVPVLFIPGNAGSYRQGRSLASEAAIYFRDYLKHDQEKIQDGVRNLDFFLVDFNEDMAAFHGQTLLDQAEYVNDVLSYILSLYQDPSRVGRDPRLPDSSSVILIGHSMGGIVARAVLTMTNYQSNSVNTIITMSTPHARPAVSFDSDIVATYRQVNDYWRRSYLQKWANNNPLWHVTLISIAGGGGDNIVPSDYTSLTSLVPQTHGFTVFTSTIPKVWTGMDHLSIAWCDSLRKTITHSLFDIVDVRTPTQTKSRAQRMSAFRKWYLTGMEVDAARTLPQKTPSTLLSLEENTNSILKPEARLVLRKLGEAQKPKAILLPVLHDNATEKKFTLLTDQHIDGPGVGQLEVLFCTAFPLKSGISAAVLFHNLDFSGGSASSTRLACKSAAEDVINLPASTHSSQFPFDDQPPFSYLQYSVEDLAEFQFVAVVDKNDRPSPGWLIAEFSDTSNSIIPTKVGLGRLLSTGLNIKLPAARPMVTEIQVPSLYSSLIAYKLKIVQQHRGDQDPLFAPLMRQYISNPYESKYFVNVKEADINLHGIAPFMPPNLNGRPQVSGASFQFWSDPSCNTSIQVSIEVDILGSLGKLTMRYRTVFAAFPLVVVSLVMRTQFKTYDQTGVFISFLNGLDVSLKSSIPLVFLSLFFLAASLANGSPTYLESASSWISNATDWGAIDFEQNDLLLGIQDSFFLFLVPLFGVITVGVCATLNYAVVTLIHILSVLYNLVCKKSDFRSHEDQRTDTLFPWMSRKRLTVLAVLFLLVSVSIPYQFAYVFACVVQLGACVKASANAREIKTLAQYNFYNYTQAIFTLMLWLVPINSLVLVVWGHNLAIHWLAPFPSHHNIFSVLPFILVTETLNSGAMVPRIITRLRHVTYLLFGSFALYSAVYGVTFAYRLPEIANYVIAWIVGVHFFAKGFSVRRGDLSFHHPGFADMVPSTTNGHTKKLP